ncbi:hypothetical protein EYF80_041445 [Liparis tanakae]|uniref:Uncharacterized protein n=1 Tax=Liparis tanakae TaxID=230148 RepID=A0A4Z2G466_9TELE|nr:hypothetical protein EYF80_041445 [Liparis tanakae]
MSHMCARVDVVPGAQQEAAPLLVQQQRVGVQPVRGSQRQGDAAGLQQFWPGESNRQTQLFSVGRSAYSNML